MTCEESEVVYLYFADQELAEYEPIKLTDFTAKYGYENCRHAEAAVLDLEEEYKNDEWGQAVEKDDTNEEDNQSNAENDDKENFDDGHNDGPNGIPSNQTSYPNTQPPNFEEGLVEWISVQIEVDAENTSCDSIDMNEKLMRDMVLHDDGTYVWLSFAKQGSQENSFLDEILPYAFVNKRATPLAWLGGLGQSIWSSSQYQYFEWERYQYVIIDDPKSRSGSSLNDINYFELDIEFEILIIECDDIRLKIRRR